MGSILDPAKLGRTILRLDLRGHGRSKSAHDNDSSSMVHQYTWSQLAKDMRKAAADSVSRSFYGGEALGAAVALEAAVAAQATRSIDASPGLVLMRPPLMLAQVAKHGSVDAKHLQEFLQIAHLVETEGFGSLEQAEAEDSTPFLNGADAAFCSVTKKELQQFRRAMDEDCLQPLAVLSSKLFKAAFAPDYRMPLQLPFVGMQPLSSWEKSSQFASRSLERIRKCNNNKEMDGNGASCVRRDW